MRRVGLIAAVLAILASALVYLPSLPGGYVYDDHRFVRLNPSVRLGEPLLRYFTDPATQTADDSYGGLYRPLRTLSFRVVALVTPGATGQRVVSLLIHLLNGLLLFLLLRRLPGKGHDLPALLGALAFLLHPLATESVAWISSRGDLLAMTGMLAGLLFHLSSRRGAGILSLCCFAAGLLSKESAVVFLLLLPVVDGYRFGLSGIRARLVSYLPFVLVLAGYLGVRLLVLGPGGFGQGSDPGRTGGELLASVLAGEAYYFTATLFPWWLTFELDLEASATLAVAGFAIVGGLLLLTWLLRRRARPVSLAILWFLAALVPVTVLQFAFPLKIEVANRFAYPALAGFGILVAFVASRHSLAPVVAGVLLAALVPQTVLRAEAWRSEEALWRDVLAAQPKHSRALYGLGVVELTAGHPGPAREHLLLAARRNPEDPKLAIYLGRACRELAARSPQGSARFQTAISEARSAYQAAVVAWSRGAAGDRALFRGAALEAAWLSMIAGDPDLAAKNAEIMLGADGALPRNGRTVRHLRELARFFEQVRRPELAAAVVGEAEWVSEGGG